MNKKKALIKGGSLSTDNINLFIKNSYDKKNPVDDINGFIKDKSLSTDEIQTYFNKLNGQVVVVFRGTEGTLTDWSNNAQYVIGNYENTDRFKRAKTLFNKIIKKYNENNLTLVGHSQGAILSRKLGKNVKEVINVNPASLSEKLMPNEYNIKSKIDVVSMFLKSNDKTTTLKNTSYNPVAEHSSEILEKVPNQIIGAGIGINKRKVKDIRNALNKYLNPNNENDFKEWIALKKADLIKLIVKNGLENKIFTESLIPQNITKIIKKIKPIQPQPIQPQPQPQKREYAYIQSGSGYHHKLPLYEFL